MTVLNSVDNIMYSQNQYGSWGPIYFFTRSGNVTTAATVNCGGVTANWCQNSITVPSFGAGVTGCILTVLNMFTEDTVCGNIGCIFYELGTLTVSGNSFSDGVAMPTKTIRGESIQTATQLAFAVVTTAMTATTPVLTITYTDQDGNTGNTATLTLPTGAALGSAFLINPHLASGDTGIRDITNISISTGSAGVVKIHGCLVLNMHTCGANLIAGGPDPLNYPTQNWPLAAGDKITFYRTSSTTTHDWHVIIYGVADY